MLELNPEIVCLLISQAHEFHAKDTLRMPDDAGLSGEDSNMQGQTPFEDDITYQAFKNTVEDLEPDQQEILVALMWLGRGDYDLEEWDAALEAAHEQHNDRTAEYLISTPLVADYLEEGLAQMGYQCDE